MRQNRETLALQAYMTLLERKGLHPQQRIQHEFVIVRLSPYLTKLTAYNGSAYRQAVDRFIHQLAPTDRPQAIMVSRAFFAFWVQDIKTIAGLMSGDACLTKSMQTIETDTLFKQWYCLDTFKLLESEQGLLAEFEDASQSIVAEDNQSHDVARRMAKFLLLHLRGIHTAPAYAYRIRIDALLPLFKALGQQSLFLQVARRFYDGWRGQHALTVMHRPIMSAPAVRAPVQRVAEQGEAMIA